MSIAQNPPNNNRDVLARWDKRWYTAWYHRSEDRWFYYELPSVFADTPRPPDEWRELPDAAPEPGNTGTMTIGRLIAALRKAKPDAPVVFDFCGLMPTHIHSDRGRYDHAALGWAPAEYWAGRGGLRIDQYPTVARLIQTLEAAIAPGAIFTGWKGGEYRYTLSTPLHIDNDGESNGTELLRVEDVGWHVILHTYAETAGD